MKTIWKFPIDFSRGDRHKIQMPIGSSVLSAQIQGGVICLWVLVDPLAPIDIAIVAICGTGHDAPDSAEYYVSTIIDGPYVWHIFCNCP